MNCPRCKHPLTPTPVQEDLEVDACRHCLGSFLLPKQATELLGPLYNPDLWIDSEICHDKGPAHLLSPVSGQPMQEYELVYKCSVVLDRCKQSNGIWLDAGEGDKLQEIIADASQTRENFFEGNKSEFGVGSYLIQLFSGIPLEVWHPTKKIAWATLILVAMCILVFVNQISLTMSSPEAIEAFVGQYAASWRSIAQLKPWQLMSYMFLHAGIGHLFGNLAILYILGDNVEEKVGIKKFIFLYFASGIAGGIAQAFSPNQSLPVIGASGAVAGIMAAYWVMFPFIRVRMVIFFKPFYFGIKWYFGIWLLYNVVMSLTGVGNVAWYCHLGGFLTGLVVAWPYRRQYYSKFIDAKLSTN